MLVDVSPPHEARDNTIKALLRKINPFLFITISKNMIHAKRVIKKYYL